MVAFQIKTFSVWTENVKFDEFRWLYLYLHWNSMSLYSTKCNDSYISISVESRWVPIRRNVMTVISLSPTDAFNKQRCQRKVDHKYICGGCDGVISKSIKSFFTRDIFFTKFSTICLCAMLDILSFVSYCNKT